jgi:ABC-type multidrug transport system ATPase subunit
MANAIEASGLRKSFGPTKALDGLELTVRTGEVHAFLGPNGAGKPVTGLRLSLPRGTVAGPAGGLVLMSGSDPVKMSMVRAWVVAVIVTSVGAVGVFAVSDQWWPSLSAR